MWQKQHLIQTQGLSKTVPVAAVQTPRIWSSMAEETNLWLWCPANTSSACCRIHWMGRCSVFGRTPPARCHPCVRQTTPDQRIILISDPRLLRYEAWFGLTLATSEGHWSWQGCLHSTPHQFAHCTLLYVCRATCTCQSSTIPTQQAHVPCHTCWASRGP